MSRNTVANALLTQLLTAGGGTLFVTSGRRLKLWGDLAANQQPAVYLVKSKESKTYKSDLSPGIRILYYSVFVYSRTVSDDSVPAIAMDDIVDAVETALAPSPVTGKLTLGGTVYHCRIEGTMIVDQGDQDGQALAIIPVTVLLP